jgi:hypothetical protein
VTGTRPGRSRCLPPPGVFLRMPCLPIALVAATLGLAAAAPPSAFARPDDIAVIGPAEGGQGAWSGERMGAARERLKDMLPGQR